VETDNVEEVKQPTFYEVVALIVVEFVVSSLWLSVKRTNSPTSLSVFGLTQSTLPSLSFKSKRLPLLISQFCQTLKELSTWRLLTLKPLDKPVKPKALTQEDGISLCLDSSSIELEALTFEPTCWTCGGTTNSPTHNGLALGLWLIPTLLLNFIST